MVQNKPLPRKFPHKLVSDWQVFGVDQDVEGQIKILQHLNAAKEFGPQ